MKFKNKNKKTQKKPTVTEMILKKVGGLFTWDRVTLIWTSFLQQSFRLFLKSLELSIYLLLPFQPINYFPYNLW